MNASMCHLANPIKFLSKMVVHDNVVLVLNFHDRTHVTPFLCLYGSEQESYCGMAQMLHKVY